MNQNSQRLEPPNISNFDEGRNTIPREEQLRYAGKHVAFSPDGTRIVAAGDDIEEVLRQLDAAGIHFSQVVHDYMDPPNITSLLL